MVQRRYTTDDGRADGRLAKGERNAVRLKRRLWKQEAQLSACTDTKPVAGAITTCFIQKAVDDYLASRCCFWWLMFVDL